MTEDRRSRLDRLTQRWRGRHDQRLRREGRQPADAQREAAARTHFPWQAMSPAEYAAQHSAAMIGYTYDAYTYADADLEAWLVELGRLLRAQRD